jgi:hypothetical protein
MQVLPSGSLSMSWTDARTSCLDWRHPDRLPNDLTNRLIHRLAVWLSACIQRGASHDTVVLPASPCPLPVSEFSSEQDMNLFWARFWAAISRVDVNIRLAFLIS